MGIRAGLAVAASIPLLAMTPTVGAATPVAPLPGDWEGTGPHGLPLSFHLARRGGRLVATSLAVGYPASCPAVSRDAEAVPLRSPAYTGPGSTGPGGPGSPVLSGLTPRGNRSVILHGSWDSPATGTFSVRIQRRVACGWPATTLSWTVHRATRTRVGDGTWTGALTASGLINGNVRLVVGAQGRVIESFASFFTCQTDTQQGNTNFRAVPAFEFVRPRGVFYSPLDGGQVGRHPTTWWGRFTASGALTGTLTIFDDCTNQLIRARFSARRTRPSHPVRDRIRAWSPARPRSASRPGWARAGGR